MITVGVIRSGASYLSHHLQKNDYWAEGEKAVQGEWIGQGAEKLGLKGTVINEAFEALRQNRHPQTGETLTARQVADRVAFFDLQLSAPKDVSVLAMVGGDERVTEAFQASVKTALAELERFAAVRERRGTAAESEKFRLTGNFAGALFFHNTSRDLDPQLHGHAVLANATWDPDRKEWFALQPAEMMRASTYVRQVLYRDLAQRLQTLGYETYGMNSRGFAIRGVEHLRERFSKRARQIEQLAQQFAAEKGRRPTKREVEVLVRESRARKLTEIATATVRARQRSELDPAEARRLATLVQTARETPRCQQSRGQVQEVLESALRHVFEQASVAREGAVLAAALELHPDFTDWKGLREGLEKHPEVLLRDGVLSLRRIWHEERITVERVREGRNQRFGLGEVEQLPENLTLGQKRAAAALLSNRDVVSVLIGDAGTGKTTVLTAIEQAHVAGGGQRFLALAPTTRARDALLQSGFASADTVQNFLMSDNRQAEAVRRVVLVDEAGLLSTEQLEKLTRLVKEVRGRLILVGDTKQHYSVQRGDALRNVIEHARLPVTRLSEVLRQRKEADRVFSRLLASASVAEAFDFANRHGMVRQAKDDQALFAQAAAHYADNHAKGVDTLVVIPFWEEIERFNAEARPALRKVGRLGTAEVWRDSVKPLPWSEEQKTYWDQYQVGDQLLFSRKTRYFKRGTAAEVVEVLPDGLRVRGTQGRKMKITQRQRGTYEVGRRERRALAAGEKILIQGREDELGFTNGEFKQVAQVDPATNRVVFTDGKELPVEFTAWTYGHALTAYRSQGSTSEESLLVMGDVASRAMSRRQFYVGNTRYRGTHTLYVSNQERLMDRLSQPDEGRELATEFCQRHGITAREGLAIRTAEAVRARLRILWQDMRNRRRRAQAHNHQRIAP